MVFETDLGSDLHGLFVDPNGPGRIFRFRYFSEVIAGSYYDDDVSLTQSGTDVWCSGIVFPVNAKQGSTEAVLIEQGRLKTSDLKMFVGGSIDLSTTDGTVWRVGVGSPNVDQYALVQEGVLAYPPIGTVVYQKAFVRRLPTGSLIGE